MRMLFHSGYCTAVSNEGSGDISLILPNKEVRQAFRDEIGRWEEQLHNSRLANSLLETALGGNIEEFKASFINAIESSVSMYDIAGRNEQSYHVLSLGFFIAGVRRGYQIHSNKEAGYGRYDIAIFPAQPNAGSRAVILEFKVFQRHFKKGNRAVIEEKLQKLAREGLSQIDNQRYHLSVPAWCTELIEYGVSFYKTHCVMLSRQRRRPVENSNWEVVSSDF